MSNTIDTNINGENNSMDSLSFYWMAEFSDGSIIEQFDENKKEHRYQEVLDRINELEFFHLHHKILNIRFIVDLKKGIIKYNNAIEPVEIEEKRNIRLIFFRRHKVEIGVVDLKEQKHEIIYHLGLQWNDKLGNNKKIILEIEDSGNFIIGA